MEFIIEDGKLKKCYEDRGRGSIKIVIPDNVISIEDGAFYSCQRIKSITIPDGVKRIGKQAFDGCTALESINIPDNVKEIGPDAFE